ncbi:MAG: zinc ribbon domain-containing protein [Ruminiclostridium sp.]|nr:zinc ribbon domain-containing protein [Ruminiclostridium sp.]
MLIIGVAVVVYIAARKKGKATVALTYTVSAQTNGQQGTKFCTNCGNPLGDNSKFCSKCGQNLP